MTIANLFPFDISLNQPWFLVFLPLVIVPFVLQWLRKQQSVVVPWAASRFLEIAWTKTQRQRQNGSFWLIVCQIALILSAFLAAAGPEIRFQIGKLPGSNDLNPGSTESSNSTTGSDTAPKPVRILLIQSDGTLDASPALQAERQNQNRKTAVYLNAAMRQTPYTVEIVTQTDSLPRGRGANYRSLEEFAGCSVLILDRLPSWSDVLTRAVRERMNKKLPVWIVWDPTDTSEERPNPSWFPVRPGQAEDWVQLYEKLNPNCPLWNDLRFQDLLSRPVELPSQKRVSLSNSEQLGGSTDGSNKTNSWQTAFENSSLLSYQGNVWIFGSDLAGKNNSLPLSPIWVPLIDRLLTVSLSSSIPDKSVRLSKSIVSENLIEKTSDPSQTSPLSRLLSVTGLGLLLILFFRFGRWGAASSRTIQREFPAESFWTGAALAGACAIILLAMAIQVSWTPVLKVKPVLLILVDDSASLTLPESSRQPFGVSRQDYLIDQLTNNQKRLERLTKSYRVFAARISTPDQVEPITDFGTWIDLLKRQTFHFPQTNLELALKRFVAALDLKSDPRSLKQVLILSDGRQTETYNSDKLPKQSSQVRNTQLKTPNSEIAQNTNDRFSFVRCPVSSICLGDLNPIPDLRWGAWTLEPELLTGQPVLIQPVLESDQLTGQKVWIELSAEPVSPPTSAVPLILARKSIVVQANRQTVELRFTPPETGTYRFRLAARLDSAPVSGNQSTNPHVSAPQERANSVIQKNSRQFGELFADNNSTERTATVTSRQTKVLLVSDRPTWEFRYLRNLLRRQNSFDVSVVLQNASAEYVQEDDRALPAFPETAEQLQAFDVLVLLGVNPDWLTSTQIQALQDYTQPQTVSTAESKTVRKGLIVSWCVDSTIENGIRILDAAALPFELSDLNNYNNQKNLGSADSSNKLKLPTLGKFQAKRTAAGAVESWLDLQNNEERQKTMVQQSESGQTVPESAGAKAEYFWLRLPDLERLFDVPELRPGVRTLAEAAEITAAEPKRDYSEPESDISDNPANPGKSPVARPLITRQPLITESGFRLEIVHLFTDTFWRWRRTPYEDAYNRFWTQLIRELGKQTDANAPSDPGLANSNRLPPEYQNSAADRSWLEAVAKPTSGRCFVATDTSAALDSIPTDVSILELNQPPIPLWNQYWLLILLYIFLFIDWTRLIVWRI